MMPGTAAVPSPRRRRRVADFFRETRTRRRRETRTRRRPVEMRAVKTARAERQDKASRANERMPTPILKTQWSMLRWRGELGTRCA